MRRNLDGEIIRTFVARIADIIRPLDPALVYFRAADAAAAFRAISDKRGMAWTLQHIGGFDGSAWARTHGASGMDGVLAYWREHAAVCDAVVAGSGLQTVTVGPEVGDWPSRRRHIAAFLGLADPPTRAGTCPISRVCREVPERAGAPGAPIDRRRRPRHRRPLLASQPARAPRAGHLRSRVLAFRLTFEADPSGRMARFRLEGPDLPHTRLAGVYEKLD